MTGYKPRPFTRAAAAEANDQGDPFFKEGAAGPNVQADTNIYIPRKGTTMPGAVYYQNQAPHYAYQGGHHHQPVSCYCYSDYCFYYPQPCMSYCPQPLIAEVSYPTYGGPLPYCSGRYYSPDEPPSIGPVVSCPCNCDTFCQVNAYPFFPRCPSLLIPTHPIMFETYTNLSIIYSTNTPNPIPPTTATPLTTAATTTPPLITAINPTPESTMSLAPLAKKSWPRTWQLQKHAVQTNHKNWSPTNQVPVNNTGAENWMALIV